MSQIRKKSLLLTLSGLLLFCCLGALFQYLYQQPANHDLTTQSFQQTLNKKWEKATAHLAEMKTGLADDKTPAPISSSEIFYYIYQNDKLIYWTENTLGVPVRYSDLDQSHPLLQLQNAYCVSLQESYGDYRLLALIKIKNKYASTNNYLANHFAEGFQFDSQVIVCSGAPTDYGAVFSPSSAYLFTLIGSGSPVEIFRVFSICCWVLGIVLLFFVIYRLYYFLGKKQLTPLFFGISTVLSGLLMISCLWLEFPNILFSTGFFSPVHYASGGIFASLGHLIIFSLWVLVEMMTALFVLKKYKLTIKNNNQWTFIVLFQILCVGVFILICLLSQNLIYNSSVRLVIHTIDSFTPASILFLLLILSWFITLLFLRIYGLRILGKQFNYKQSMLSNLVLALIGVSVSFSLHFSWLIPLWYILFCFTIDRLYTHRGQFFTFSHLSILTLLVSLFVVGFIDKYSEDKSTDKYHSLAENIHFSGILERNAFAEILLEDLSTGFYTDHTLLEMLQAPNPSHINIQNYLYQNYFRGFWDNYEVKIYLYNPEEKTHTDEEKERFYSQIKNSSEQIKDSPFYFVGDKKTKIDYIGILPFTGRTLYLEFYSDLMMSQYSYPKPLLDNEETQSHIGRWISVARYENGTIFSQTGRFPYPPDIYWIPRAQENNFSFTRDKYIHHVYSDTAGNATVISQRQRSLLFLFSYWVYLFVLYLLVINIIYGIYCYINRKHIHYSFRFYTKLQLSYLSLLIISFIAIFYVSANYVIEQYERQQNRELQEKTKYIQQFIQETFKEADHLEDRNIVELGFYLQDLSRTYRTDIHIYDPQGYLLTSSQPLIFSKGLMSSYISAIPFFDKKDNYTQTEQIGKLNYLSAYTQIHNSKGQLLGYIAVPSFLSADEMHREIFSLLSKFVNIGLVIILLALLFSALINRKLSKPIKALEEKLRSISLKGKNEKLYYPRKDEIGHLVEQYNQMLIQLEKSAEKFARSERETAWKQMARQVTHEINNPLTPMKLTVQQLQRMQAAGNEEFNQYFEKTSQILIEQIEHLSRIATTFSNFAKMPEARLEQINLPERLAAVVDLFKHNNEQVQINYTHPDQEIIILADKEQIAQVFNNLLKNAIQSIPADKKGEITINLSKQHKTALVQIKDNGTGIPDELKDKIFNPNFTTKTSGMGLGLAIVHNIITTIGGNIKFQTTNAGTTFFIELPIEEQKTAASLP